MRWNEKWGGKWGCPAEDTGTPDGNEPFPRNISDLCELWLWWQYDRKVNMQTLCRIFGVIFGEIDASISNIIANRGLATAVGGEVDAWGAAVGVLRNGVSDSLLKRKIQAKARAAIGHGQPVDFFEVMTLIAPQSNPRFLETVAHVRMFFDAVDEDEEEAIFELMKLVPGLGICISFVQVDPNGVVFEFSYLDSVVGIPPRVTFPITYHWDFFPDRDIPPNQSAGFAFLIE